MGSKELAVRSQVHNAGSVEQRTRGAAEGGLQLRFLMPLRAGCHFASGLADRDSSSWRGRAACYDRARGAQVVSLAAMCWHCAMLEWIEIETGAEVLSESAS